tara:strand:- start:4387 stop:5325 length:939 start_codon:yes stop_codon:yes gene_type:complete
MARHLIVGDGTAYGVTAGLVDDGAVSVEKMSASGPTELVLGDTPADAPQIRIIGGGTDGRNIVTPWIYGKDIVNWSGQSYAAQVAQIGTVVFAGGSSTAAYDLNFKLINKTNGASPYELKSYTVTIPSGTSNTGAGSVGSLINDAVNLDMPHWIKTFAWGTATITITGYKKGEVKADGSIQEDVVLWDLADNSADWSVHTATVDVDSTSAASRGVGDVHYLKQFENELMGTSHGYYNRLELPNTPTNQVLTTNTYDMYSLVATKDGSSSSQIHGVDNLIEINLGLKPGDADSLVVENKINAYLAGLFPNVIL